MFVADHGAVCALFFHFESHFVICRLRTKALHESADYVILIGFHVKRVRIHHQFAVRLFAFQMQGVARSAVFGGKHVKIFRFVRKTAIVSGGVFIVVKIILPP